MLARAMWSACSRWKARACAARWSIWRPDRFRGHHRAGGAVSPGTDGEYPTYCARKHGDEEPEYLHPMLEPILKETFGVIIYQEQVMQIAQVMAGYSLGEADLLRRAMGKKIRKEMEQQRERFVSGAIQRGIQSGRPTRFSNCSQNSRITASTRAMRGLRAGVVSYRLYEDALSGRVLAASMSWT